MAVKIPLVLGSDGRVQQLQSGDSIAGTDTSRLTMQAQQTTIAGAPVYVSAADAATYARANGSPQTFAVGLAVAAITSLANGSIQFSGILTLTTAEWDAVFGTTGGLTAGATYYLSTATAGRGQATAPSTVGQYVVILGKAISTTEFEITIREPILL